MRFPVLAIALVVVSTTLVPARDAWADKAAELAQAKPDPMAQLETAVERHCRRCHTARHKLDLSRLPARNDTATWLRMLDAVEDFRMPPASGTGKQRYPLQPGERTQLIEQFTAVLGRDADVPALPERLPPRAWAVEVDQVLGGGLVDKLTGPKLMSFAESDQRGFDTEPLIVLRSLSTAECRRAAEARAVAGGDWRLESLSALVLDESEKKALVALTRKLGRAYSERDRWEAACVYLLISPRRWYGGALQDAR